MSWVWLPSAQKGETNRPGGQVRDSGHHVFPRSHCLAPPTQAAGGTESPPPPPKPRTSVPGTASSGQEVSCGLFSLHVQRV